MRLLLAIALFGAACARPQAAGSPPTTLGTGPFKASYYMIDSLPNHTIYEPVNKEGLKIPVVVWGNGGCYISGTGFSPFLGEVASHGVMLIAPGGTSAGIASGQTTVAYEKASIDWVIANAGKGNYTHVDGSRIGAWGQSCGGLEAMSLATDDRVSSIGVFDSGQFSAAQTQAVTSKITKPTFFFMGGSTDIAYSNAERDYAALPAGTPTWKGQNNKGHMSTFFDANAGMVGTAGSRYAEWVLRGNATAGLWFTSDQAKTAGYTDVVAKDLDKIKVTPI